MCVYAVKQNASVLAAWETTLDVAVAKFWKTDEKVFSPAYNITVMLILQEIIIFIF